MFPAKALLPLVVAALASPVAATAQAPVRNPFDRAAALPAPALVTPSTAASPSVKGPPTPAVTRTVKATQKPPVPAIAAVAALGAPLSAASGASAATASNAEGRRLACEGVHLQADLWAAKAVGDVLRARFPGAGGVACVSALGVDQEWVVLTRLNGSSEVDIAAEPNASGKSRQALVHIVTPAKTLTLRVRQDAEEGAQREVPVAIR